MGDPGRHRGGSRRPLSWGAVDHLTSLGVDGRFLQASDTEELHAEADRAGAEGAAAVFVSEDVLGDPVVLAAGLGRCSRECFWASGSGSTPTAGTRPCSPVT